MAGGSEGPSGSPKKRKGLRKLLPRSRKKHGPALLHRASVDPIRRAALQQESQRSLQVQAQASVPCETHSPEGICTILSMQGPDLLSIGSKGLVAVSPQNLQYTSY